jgi:hypothetical protein
VRLSAGVLVRQILRWLSGKLLAAPGIAEIVGLVGVLEAAALRCSRVNLHAADRISSLHGRCGWLGMAGFVNVVLVSHLSHYQR